MSNCYRCCFVYLPHYAFFILFCTLSWSIPGNAEKAEPMPHNPIINKSGASDFLGTGRQTFIISLPDSPVDMKAISGNKTGIVYSLPSPVTASQVTWEPITNGGYVARIHVSSHQAKHLRFHLVVDSNIRPISIRVKGNLDNSPIGPVNDTDIQGGAIWLPVTNGNSADLEIFVDTASLPESLDLKVDAVNLIVADVNDNSVPPVIEKSLGLAEEEQYDLACWTEAANAEGEAEIVQGLIEAASATALIHFVKGQSSYLCTGTLLADKAQTGIPWFATADHCIHDQATANSIVFEWFFQATTCGGKTNDSRYTQTVGGAQLLWTNATLDASFLRLNRPPANDVILSGWDTSIEVGDPVWGVHHPRGDHIMVSEGNVAALRITVQSEDGKSRLLNSVNYTYGGTEVGSSGSGLFSLENGHAYWKGTLSSGPASNYQIANYSDFASYYANLEPFLNNPSMAQIGCLLNSAEVPYPERFSPADSDIYYLGPGSSLRDEEDVASHLARNGC